MKMSLKDKDLERKKKRHKYEGNRHQSIHISGSRFEETEGGREGRRMRVSKVCVTECVDERER